MFLNSPEGEKIKGEVVVDEVILNCFLYSWFISNKRFIDYT